MRKPADYSGLFSLCKARKGYRCYRSRVSHQEIPRCAELLSENIKHFQSNGRKRKYYKNGFEKMLLIENYSNKMDGIYSVRQSQVKQTV